ncbi:MAG: CHAT domain-containing protein [Fuerstiella sp.]
MPNPPSPRILRQTFGDDDPRTLKIQGRQADVLARLDRQEEAVRSYDHILQALTRQTKPDQRWIARTRLQLEFLKLNPDDPQTVTAILNRIAVFETEFPSDAGFAESRQEQLVTTLLAVGQTKVAFQIMDSMLKQLRQQIRVDIWGMSAQQQADYLVFADGSRFFSAIAAAVGHLDSADVIRQSSEWLINGKGLVREAQSVQSGYRDDLQRRQSWADEPYVTATDVRQALPDGAVFVDLIRYDVSADSSSRENQSASHYAAWLTPKAGSQQIILLGDAQQIDSQIAELRTQLTQTARRVSEIGPAEAMAILKPALQAVSRQVWRPIAAACKESRLLIISPDQSTWLLPWSALLNDDDRTFAVETHRLQLELSGRDLLLQDNNDVGPAAIFADPDYGPVRNADAAPEGRGPGFIGKVPSVSALAYSAQEAAAARPALELVTGRPPVMLLGQQAEESRFKQLHSPAVVLLSTHGFFLASPDLPVDVADTGDPLLRCGLMLAGANRHRAIDQLDNDGVLTGLEILQSDLRHTQLAVLSACETGVGRLEATGGVIGLRRAFHLAGVRCVMSTLWSIPDLETALLVRNFFDSLTRTADVRSALQAAQRQRIQELRSRHGAAHPYFWAAFTVSGNCSRTSLQPSL